MRLICKDNMLTTLTIPFMQSLHSLVCDTLLAL